MFCGTTVLASDYIYQSTDYRTVTGDLDSVSVQTTTWPEGGFRGPLTPHRHGDDDDGNVSIINLPLNSRIEAEDIFILNNTKNNKGPTY